MQKMNLQENDETLQIDQSTEDQKCVLHTIEDDRKLAATEKPGANEYLPSDDKNFNEETEDWHDKIPSYLEVKTKEIESPLPYRRDSAEKIATTAMAHCSTSGHEYFDSSGNSPNEPMESVSCSKRESLRDLASDVSYKSPTGEQAAKSKFLGNAHGKSRSSSSLNRNDEILQATEKLEANESLPSDDKNFNEETEDWHDKIPSYLEVKTKEIESPLPYRRDSAENIATMAMAHCSTSSHESFDSSGNCPNEPMESESCSKRESLRDFANDVSYKSPTGEQAAKSKFLGNAHGKSRSTSSLNRNDETLQAGFHFSTAEQSQKVSYLSNENQVSSGVVARAMTIMPVSNQNISMTINRDSPVSSEIINPSQAEIIAQSKIQNNTEHGYSKSLPSMETADYNHTSTGHSEVMRNNIEASTSVHSTKQKTSHGEVSNNINHGNPFKPTYKTASGYSRHLEFEKYISHVNKVGPHLPNLPNLETTIANTPFGSTNLQTPLPPHLHPMMYHPFWLQQFQTPTNLQTPQPPHLHPMMYHPFWLQQFQTNATTSVNQSTSDGAKLNNYDVQKSDHRISEYNYSEDSLPHIRSLDDMRTKRYSQKPSHMTLPYSRPIDSQTFRFPPSNPLLENLMTVSPKYSEKRSPQPSRAYKDVLSANHPGNTGEAGFIQNPEASTVVPLHEREVMRLYHCMICSVFHTDVLQELEQHICTDRSRTPSDLIVASGNDIFCTLCQFKTQISEEMGRHCVTFFHLRRVQYYNHVLEGGVHNRIKLDMFHDFDDVLILCSACDLIIKSAIDLKSHIYHPGHQHNASCCLYLASISSEIEYFFCGLCIQKTFTKKQLLLHAQSKEHHEKLRFNPANGKLYPETKHIFFAEELNLSNKKTAKISE